MSCAAAAVAVEGVNSGDTASGFDVITGSCTSPQGGGRESVLSFTVPGAAGEPLGMTLQLVSKTDQGLSVRTVCADDDSELACVDAAGAGATESLSLPVTAGQTLSLVVEAYEPGEAGPFELSIVLVGASASCDAATVAMDGDTDGTTATGLAVMETSCNNAIFGGAGGNEQVYEYTVPGAPEEMVVVTFSLTSVSDHGLAIRGTCLDPATELACQDAIVDDQTPEVTSLVLAGGTTVFVVVEAFAAGQEGPFTLNVATVPAP